MGQPTPDEFAIPHTAVRSTRKEKTDLVEALNHSVGTVRAREQCLRCGSTLPPDRSSLSASIVRRCVGWQTHLGSVDPFTGDRRSCESILRRHLRVWPVSILQEDRPHWRDLYSIAPDAKRSGACCFSEPPSGLFHLGSIPRQSQPPRSEPDQQRGSRWACSRGSLLAAGRVALWHLRAASEYTLYR